MCYDVKTKLETQLKRARRKGDKDWQKELEDQIEPYTKDFFCISGFSHPSLVIYTQQKPFKPTLAQWGLVPSWTKDEVHKTKLWNSTLNARLETLNEKPSFKESIVHKRCILQVDGFYEHHYFNGKKYPYYIFHKDSAPLTLAGLWSEWHDEKFFTIVTTKGNAFMKEIHNSPRLNEARMPLLLNTEFEEQWLVNEAINFKHIPIPDTQLKAHTVQAIRGNKTLGNTEEASHAYFYEDLNTLLAPPKGLIP